MNHKTKIGLSSKSKQITLRKYFEKIIFRFPESIKVFSDNNRVHFFKNFYDHFYRIFYVIKFNIGKLLIIAEIDQTLTINREQHRKDNSKKSR